MTSLLRATFGRLSLTTLGRVTIGHIQTLGTVLDKYGRRIGHTGGKSKESGVRFIPLIDEYKRQRLREDVELLELVSVMIEGNVL